MADFSIPFGENSERRMPNAEEKSLGFPCGPADQKLFNGLIHQIQKELKTLHEAAGIPGDNNVYNTTLLAIQALIAAATGGGATEDYLLMSQARARLPIFPEIVSADNRINVSSPAAGTVRLPGGVTFMHRGILPIQTVQTDFATIASQIYHLRWYAPGVGRATPAATYPDGRYFLESLGDVTYNPNGYADSNTFWDSTYDNMLIARVVTNSSNVPTITNLANAHRMKTTFSKNTKEVRTDFTQFTDLINAGFIINQNLNWARTPITFVISADAEGTNGFDSLTTPHTESTRYISKGWAFGYGWIGATNTPAGYTSGKLTMGLMA